MACRGALGPASRLGAVARGLEFLHLLEDAIFIMAPMSGVDADRRRRARRYAAPSKRSASKRSSRPAGPLPGHRTRIRRDAYGAQPRPTGGTGGAKRTTKVITGAFAALHEFPGVGAKASLSRSAQLGPSWAIASATGAARAWSSGGTWRPHGGEPTSSSISWPPGAANFGRRGHRAGAPGTEAVVGAGGLIDRRAPGAAGARSAAGACSARSPGRRSSWSISAAW